MGRKSTDPTAITFLRLEDKLGSLEKKLDDATISEDVELQIKEICRRLCLNPDEEVRGPLGRELTAAERFYFLFNMRNQSSGSFIDYITERNRLWTMVAERSAKKHGENLKDLTSRRWDHNSRDMQMAREFRRLTPKSDRSDTALKADIGHRRGLGRSASVDAINRGLRLLDRESG